MNYTRTFSTKFRFLMQRITTTDINYFEEQFRYGHREIILNFVRQKTLAVNESSILIGSIDHGWAPHENIWRIRTRNFKFANRYLWTEERLLNYSKKENASAVGAPWLYMLADLGITKENVIDKLPKNKTKVVLFPGHSDLHPGYTNILDQIKQMYKNIPKNSHAVVCLYWVDFMNPALREEIEAMNLEVYTAGYVSLIPYQDTSHAGRPNFLLELFNMVRDADLIITSELATSTFYAMSLGAKVCYTPINTERQLSNDFSTTLGPKENKYFFKSTSEWIESFFPLFYTTTQNPQTFIDFAWDELGLESFKKNISGAKFKWKNAKANKHSIIVYQNRLTQIKRKIANIKL